VKDLEPFPGKDFLQDPEGPEAEDEHFRKESETGGGELEKIERAENAPGRRWREKIFSYPPEVHTLHRKGAGPGHGPGIGRPHQNGGGMTHPGQLPGEKIEVNPLPAAVRIAAVGEETNVHLPPLGNPFFGF
jgi:hypothetical protein